MMRAIQDPVLRRLVERIRAQVDPDFEFASPGPAPWCPPPARVLEAPVALITTSGLHLKGDRPFTALENPLGDTSFRVIAAGTPASALDLTAPYIDQRFISADPEVAIPLRALDALHRQGLAGPPAARHASFCGGIVRPLPGLEKSASDLAALLREDGVRVVLLFPSCPLCVQTVCLLARALESDGFSTVCVTLVPELTGIVGAPRSLALRFRFGAPCGDPGNAALHRAVIQSALALLEEAREPGTVHASSLLWREPRPDQ